MKNYEYIGWHPIEAKVRNVVNTMEVPEWISDGEIVLKSNEVPVDIRIIQRDLFSKLSIDAKTILSMIINHPPDEILTKKRVKRAKLKKYMENRWGKSRKLKMAIDEVFEFVQQI